MVPGKPEVLVVPTQWPEYFVESFVAFELLTVVKFRAHPN